MSRDVTQLKSRLVAGGRGVAKRHPEDVRFGERARVFAAEAREVRESLGPPPSSAADRRVLECARDSVDPAVPLYVSAQTDDRQVPFAGEEFELLRRAMNDWLTMYARCYGVGPDADFTVRKAAEVLLRAHNVVDTVQLLACVSKRR